jgi:hypothetical protein
MTLFNDENGCALSFANIVDLRHLLTWNSLECSYISCLDEFVDCCVKKLQVGMTFCATALTLHDERIFRQAPLPHLPNLFFIFYFQNHKMKFILANLFYFFAERSS